MKIRKIFAIVLAVAISLSCAVQGNAEEVDSNNTVEYESIFADALTVDGAYSEGYSGTVASLFYENPTEFLNALSFESNDTIEAVVSFVVAAVPKTDLGEMLDILEKLEIDEQYNSPLILMYDKINSRLGESHGQGSYVRNNEMTYAFEPYKIKSAIENALGEDTADDEELNYVLTKAYEASPTQFADLIETKHENEISVIAQKIANGLKKAGHEIPEFDSAQELGETAHFLQNEIEASLREVDVVITEPISPDVSVMSTCVPTIGAMNYTSGDLDAYENETLTVKLTETSQISSQRQWWVEVYQVVNGTYTKKAAKQVTMTAGSSSVTASFTLKFYTACSFSTHVKVYSYEGGSLLTTRTGSSPDVVYGRWSIIIGLPTDRDYLGELNLFSANGDRLIITACLGKSVDDLPMSETNGDTPTGTYTGYLHGPISSNTVAYGPYKVVAMDGVSGKIMDYSHRYGIWIHGGREGVSDTDDPYYPLYPTYGCVRVSNAAQKNLQDSITSLVNNSYHRPTGDIYISEVE